MCGLVIARSIENILGLKIKLVQEPMRTAQNFYHATTTAALYIEARDLFPYGYFVGVAQKGRSIFIYN
jgi:hypothetical protein